MKIEKNRVVELTYELEVEGEIVDKSTTEKPLDYIHGTHMLLPKFESEIEGKEPGDSFAFTLTPEEGYGEVDPNKIIDLPKSAFAIDGEVQEDLLVVGKVIPMLNSAGMVVQGTVKEVKGDNVTMDFNLRMAGKTLNFSGAIVSVREATEKELTEGLHGEFLPQQCHCGGGCHGGCEGGCHGDGECHSDGHECNCHEGTEHGCECHKDN